MEKCPRCMDDVLFYQKKNEYICVNTIECGWRGLLENSIRFNFEFYEDVYESFPFLIAHEYYQLSQLIENQKIYGALLQLRDVFEVTIKLPTLTAISILRSNNEYDSNIFSRLLFSSLSLGDWYDLANLCSNIKTDILPTNLKQLLKSIVKLFKNKKQDICEWRNSKIGHGALTIDEQYCWRNLILPYLESLNVHYIENKELYTVLNYVDSNKRSLTGKNSCEKLEKIFVDSTQQIELFPYVYSDKEGIFLFDTYYSNKKKVSLLNYPGGIKKEDKNVVYNKLTNDYQYLRKKGVFEQREKYVNDTSLSQRDIEQLYELQKVEDFIKPSYCQQYVINMLEKYSNGIFLLQMEQGMGKTTFVQALDELQLRKIKLNKTSVRSYYFNNTFASDVQYFLEHVIDMLRSNSDGKLEIKRGTLIQPQSPEQWIELLNDYYEAHVKHFQVEKVVLIFDGLDEINSKETKIWDFICITEELKQKLYDNIYIFYTCRTDSEISNIIQSYLNTIALTHEPFIMTKEKDIYRETLKRYLNKTELEQILPITNGRFTEVSLVVQLSKAGLTVYDESSIFKQYIKFLEQQYDKKFMRQLIDVILLITYAKEPITIEEIAFALQEPISLKLLGYIYDLRPILSIRQYQNRHVLSLSHDSWVEDSKAYFTEHLDRFIVFLSGFEKDYEPSSIDVLDEDAEFLSYIYSNYGDLFLPILSEEEQIQAMNMMYQIALMFNENNLYPYRWQRSEIMLKWIIKQPVYTFNRKSLRIAAYNQLANTAYKRLQLDLALEIIKEGIEWVSNLHIYDRPSLSNTLSIQLKIVFELQRYDEVQAILDQLEYIQSDDSIENLILKRNIATFIIKLDRNSKAKKILKDVVKQLENKVELNSDEVMLLSLSYDSLREANIYLQHLQQAIDASNKAIKSLQQVRKMSVDKYETNAINIFHNNGDVYFKAGSYKKALEGYTISINLQLKFEQDEQFVDYDRLVDSLQYRVQCYFKLNDIEAQLNDLNLICKYSKHVNFEPLQLIGYRFFIVQYQNSLELFENMQKSIPLLIEECKNLDFNNEKELEYFKLLSEFAKVSIKNKDTKQLFITELLRFIKVHFSDDYYESVKSYLNEN